MFGLPRPDLVYRRLRFSLRPPDVDAPLVEDLLAAYGLTLLARPQVPGGRGRSRSLLVQTSQGRKVLKGYKSTVTLPTIAHEHSILRYLAQVNFPAPRLMATPQGETVLVREGAPYALFDFIPGGMHYHHYLWLPGQVRRFIAAAGQALAELHAQLRDFDPIGHTPNGFTSRTGDWARDLDWHVRALNAAATAGVVPVAADLEARLVRLDSDLRAADLPRTIIHSDYGPYNLLFRGNALLAVLDFEIARLDWRLSEFVYAFPRFGRSRLAGTRLAGTRMGYDFAALRCFLDAYRAAGSGGTPLTADELAAIPAVWQFNRLRRAIVCWSRVAEAPDAAEWSQQARAALLDADWMAAQQREFMAGLSGS